MDTTNFISFIKNYFDIYTKHLIFYQELSAEDRKPKIIDSLNFKMTFSVLVPFYIGKKTPEELYILLHK